MSVLHTAENISNVLKEVFYQFDIPDKKIYLLANVIAANMATPVVHVETESVLFFLHTLHFGISQLTMSFLPKGM